MLQHCNLYTYLLLPSTETAKQDTIIKIKTFIFLTLYIMSVSHHQTC